MDTTRTAHLSSTIDPNGLQQLFNVSHSLAPREVLIQLAIMTGLSILTIITFNLLRPNNKFVYEPKVKYHATDKSPPRISESFFGWIPPLLHNHEPEVLKKSGLDAVVFLRFLHLLRWLFTLVALIACGALIPLDFLYTLSIKPPQYDILSAMSIRDVRGVRLYAHIGSTYVFTAILMLLLHHHWKGIYRLRNQWFRSTEYQHLFHVRVLCVTHIPPRRQSDNGLYNIFVGMQLPYPVTSVHIGKHVGDLPKLLEKHNDAVKELEEAVAKYTKDGESAKIPTIVVGGFMGLGGTRVDAIKYYTSKVKQAEGAVQQYRAQMNPNRTENYGFATMSTIPFAHAAALELRHQHPKGLTIKLAPHPRDIIWHNLGLSRPNRQFRRFTGFLLLAIFSLLSLFPLFPVASLANLDALAASGVIPFLRTWAAESPFTYTLVSGTLPTAIASFFGYFLPRLMRWLSEYMGASTYSGLDRIVIARYYSFLIISQLIVFTALGVVFQSVYEIVVAVQKTGINLHTILHNLDKLPAEITHTYVDQSAFWLKWFPMQGFFIIFNLAQLGDLFWLSFKTRVYGRTPREIREFSKPPVFGYAMSYSSLLFMATVGLLFAPLVPLVSLAAAVVFWLCSWIYKYQLMFVFVTQVETGGRMWNVVANRLLFGGMFMQVIMVLTIALQDQFKSLQFVATLPPLLFLLLFKHYLNQKYANLFQYYLPDHVDHPRAIVHTEASDSGGNKLEERYCHPALKTDLFSPMIHSRALELLQHVYGRKTGVRDRARSVVETKKPRVRMSTLGDETAVEGVSFNPVHEDTLEYDPEEYRRDRELIDCDYDSFPATPVNASVVNSHRARSSSRPRRGVQLSDPGPIPSPTPNHPNNHRIERGRTTTVTSPAPSYQTVNPLISQAGPKTTPHDSRPRRHPVRRNPRRHEHNVATEPPWVREHEHDHDP